MRLRARERAVRGRGVKPLLQGNLPAHFSLSCRRGFTPRPLNLDCDPDPDSDELVPLSQKRERREKEGESCPLGRARTAKMQRLLRAGGIRLFGFESALFSRLESPDSLGKRLFSAALASLGSRPFPTRPKLLGRIDLQNRPFAHLSSLPKVLPTKQRSTKNQRLAKELPA